MNERLKQAIINESHRLGFLLAGVTTPYPPPHLSVFENWIGQGRNGSMDYLSGDRSRARRADPRLILPECKSILVLALPYTDPKTASVKENVNDIEGQIASYAWGDDYHLVIPKRLQALVDFIDKQVGHSVPNRWYTDTGPILERDLAQRAGLGWIGKNTCLINPRHGSYFLLAEILLGIELEPDPPFQTDQCGTCTRCIEACPTECILPDRTIDARRCISYLTIELKDDIPTELRSFTGNWIFGCDICQTVCPWNRFAASDGDPVLAPREDVPHPNLIRELELTSEEFNRKFKNSPIKRTKHRGYLRNVAVALGKSKDAAALPTLKKALNHPDLIIREHAKWALEQIETDQS
ncbi:MAG: tRNA epoxyqueuosine(34) reductase QueG [Anaerolineales bacterium]